MNRLLDVVSPGDLWSGITADQFERSTDRELVARVADVLVVPRTEPADSFVLHAPLELAARAALLPRVRPDARGAARLRLVALAGGYESWGGPVPTPSSEAFDDLPTATRYLVDAIDSGDLDGVDVAARWLGRAADPDELVSSLAEHVVTRTAAAAHAPIFLYHLPRLAGGGGPTGELVRGLARELARSPQWRLRWIDGRTEAGVRPDAAPEALLDSLSATPRLGVPESTFIFPLMDQVDRSGVAAALLESVTGGRSVAPRALVLARAAAWSMLQEPPDHAAYGWSHCLTIPQAIMGIAGNLGDPAVALAAASTHVVGFRAALASRRLDPDDVPAAPDLDPPDVLSAGPDAAAAWAWHRAGPDRADLWTDVVTAAAVGRDAHHVKYVLACVDAAAGDPSHEHLYLAAAAYLTAWWRDHPDPSDPLGRGASG